MDPFESGKIIGKLVKDILLVCAGAFVGWCIIKKIKKRKKQKANGRE